MGGRKLLNERMISHYSHLTKMKPSMNTREKPFVHCSTKQKRKEQGKSSKHAVTETDEAFRRVSNCRGEVDHARPHSA